MCLPNCAVQYGELFRPKSKMWDEIFGSEVLMVYFGMWVQDVFAETRGVIWRAVPAKVKHARWNLRVWGFDSVSQDISGRYFRWGLQKCVVQCGELFPQIPKQGRVVLPCAPWAASISPLPCYPAAHHCNVIFPRIVQSGVLFASAGLLEVCPAIPFLGEWSSFCCHFPLWVLHCSQIPLNWDQPEILPWISQIYADLIVRGCYRDA